MLSTAVAASGDARRGGAGRGRRLVTPQYRPARGPVTPAGSHPGDLHGEYVVTQQHPDGTLVLEPDTSARAILRRMDARPATGDEFDAWAAEHGPLYAIELLTALRKAAARFTVSVPRTTAMWKALERIADDAWRPATGMDGAEVAETTYTPQGWKHEPLRLVVRRRCFSARELSRSPRARRLKTIHPEQLQLVLTGRLASVYGYSFILTDIAEQPAAAVERFHRHRAQIDERLKDAKLGQALRRLPSADINANRPPRPRGNDCSGLVRARRRCCFNATRQQSSPSVALRPGPADHIAPRDSFVDGRPTHLPWPTPSSSTPASPTRPPRSSGSTTANYDSASRPAEPQDDYLTENRG